ncbi:MAG: hypothetical protein HDQ99_19860 [Lachnospiraceae bacterium]|nr:hypothetical protein [Lachnospiraceae bacterium]
MISHKEYKVLCIIKQIIDEESTSTHTPEFLFKSKIEKKVKTLKIEDYELNEIMRSLNKQEYICNLFNVDTNAIHGASITDSGLLAIKNYKKDLAKYIFKRYIWVLFTIIITAILTGYFTSFFTK